MARRRGAGGGNRAAFGQSILSALFQDMLLSGRQEADDARQRSMANEAALRGFALSTVDPIMQGTMLPDQVPNEIRSALPFDLAQFRPPDSALTAPLYETISKGKTQVDVPTEDDIVSYFRGRNLDTDPVISGFEPLQGAENLPFVLEGAYGLDQDAPPALQQALDQREGKLSSIDSAQELEMDRELAMARGTAYNTGMGTEQATAENFPAVLGRETQAFQNETQNEIGRATNPDFMEAQQGLNQAETFGSTFGTQDATLQPGFIDARVDEANRKARGAAEAQAQFRPQTDAMARAQGQLPQLLDAHTRLQEFERARIDLSLWSPKLSQFPGGNKLIGPEQQQILQSAQQWLNISSYILTGVTARPDEYTRYLGTYIGIDGDTDVARANKARARQLFNDSVARRAQSGVGGTLEEVHQEVMEQLGQGGEPNLPDGVPGVNYDRQAYIDALEQARTR